MKHKKTFRPNSNSTDCAVALSYDDIEMDAPIVSAIGEQELAKLLQQIARRYAIPLVKNETLLEKLRVLKEEQKIPPDLYLEIAQLFSQLTKSKTFQRKR